MKSNDRFGKNKARRLIPCEFKTCFKVTVINMVKL